MRRPESSRRRCRPGRHWRLWSSQAAYAIFSQRGLETLSREPDIGAAKATDPGHAAAAVWPAVTAWAKRASYWLEQWRAALTHARPRQIEPVDTCGAGDVFHGAFAVAMAEKMNNRPGHALCRVAAAALKCLTFGGSLGVPDRASGRQIPDGADQACHLGLAARTEQAHPAGHRLSGDGRDPQTADPRAGRCPETFSQPGRQEILQTPPSSPVFTLILRMPLLHRRLEVLVHHTRGPVQDQTAPGYLAVQLLQQALVERGRLPTSCRERSPATRPG
jgi:hypothetical protein